MKNVELNNLPLTIAETLEMYRDDVAEKTKQAVRETAKECREEIKAKSPKRKKNGGTYQKGWRMKVTRESANDLSIKIYNRQYQLTHLLEYGHATVNGKRVEGIPHIIPAAQKARNKLLAAIRKAVSE